MKPKKYSWTDLEIKQLINLREEKQMFWDEIAEKLSRTELACKTTYNKNKKRIKKNNLDYNKEDIEFDDIED